MARGKMSQHSYAGTLGNAPQCIYVIALEPPLRLCPPKSGIRHPGQPIGPCARDLPKGVLLQLIELPVARGVHVARSPATPRGK
jgi:hypothetical protein